MIKIDIKVGDTILGGKFRNKKIVVKTIGEDDYGNPTVNGKSILNVRVPKLYMSKDELLKNKIIEELKKL